MYKQVLDPVGNSLVRELASSPLLPLTTLFVLLGGLD